VVEKDLVYSIWSLTQKVRMHLYDNLNMEAAWRVGLLAWGEDLDKNRMCSISQSSCLLVSEEDEEGTSKAICLFSVGHC
jgi:hypothetical protein